ncbi:MAG: hypothetical protein J5846_06940 [Desulfovibrio sp.]|nr:hypothetical protein [Desulfovibrio sp.]
MADAVEIVLKKACSVTWNLARQAEAKLARAVVVAKRTQNSLPFPQQCLTQSPENQGSRHPANFPKHGFALASKSPSKLYLLQNPSPFRHQRSPSFKKRKPGLLSRLFSQITPQKAQFERQRFALQKNAASHRVPYET